jgi:hypothetical protein
VSCAKVLSHFVIPSVIPEILLSHFMILSVILEISLNHFAPVSVILPQYSAIFVISLAIFVISSGILEISLSHSYRLQSPIESFVAHPWGACETRRFGGGGTQGWSGGDGRHARSERRRREACRIIAAATGEEHAGSTRGVGVCGPGRLGRAGFGPSVVVGLDPGDGPLVYHPR